MLVVNKESDSSLPSPGCKPEQQMMYAGSKNRLVQAAELTKVCQSHMGNCGLAPRPFTLPESPSSLLKHFCLKHSLQPRVVPDCGPEHTCICQTVS